MTNEELLQQAKDQVADKYNYKDWHELLVLSGAKYEQETILLAIQKAREETKKEYCYFGKAGLTHCSPK